jgi:nitrogen-specific signal transduction histidine kinase
MSENKAVQKNYENIFSACEENVDTLINGIKRSVPHYHQSITNVQQEYMQACENMFDTSIKLQKEYVKKTGIAVNIPETILKIFHNMTKEFVKASSIQNQIALTTIDAIQENIKTFNDNTQSFGELNKNSS